MILQDIQNICFRKSIVESWKKKRKIVDLKSFEGIKISISGINTYKIKLLNPNIYFFVLRLLKDIFKLHLLVNNFCTSLIEGLCVIAVK